MKRINISCGIILMLVLAVLAGCKSESMVTPEQQHLMDKTKKLFTRIKARDYEAIYDNELPYLKDKQPLEIYLNNSYLKYYNTDTLLAIQVDSVTYKHPDTALCFMELEWLLSDSSITDQTIRLGWLRCDTSLFPDGEWYKPTLTSIVTQQDFETELRIYWDAVKELQAEEEADSAGASGGE